MSTACSHSRLQPHGLGLAPCLAPMDTSSLNDGGKRSSSAADEVRTGGNVGTIVAET